MGSNIHFYVLKESQNQRILIEVCKIIENYYRVDRSIFVLAPNETLANRFDQLLWTYSDTSFLPHELLSENSGSTPIVIGTELSDTYRQRVLINLTDEVPAGFDAFEEVIEVVSADPVAQQQARNRYKTYRAKACKLNTITR